MASWVLEIELDALGLSDADKPDRTRCIAGGG